MTDNSNNSNNSNTDDWCTIESDPGVFTEMIQNLGCTNIEFDELYSFDNDTVQLLLSQTKTIYGLIFLFQWYPELNNQLNTISTNNTNTIRTGEPLQEDQIPSNVFFAQQVTTNACATQAILNILFNSINNNTLSLSSNENNDDNTNNNNTIGTTLSEFYTFTKSFTSNVKGIAISSSNEIKNVHNSFRRPDAFLTYDQEHQQRSRPIKDEEKADTFHFVAYVPVDDTVYELDGLQSGPIVIGKVNSTTSSTTETTTGDSSTTTTGNNTGIPAWISIARAAIQERMVLAGEENVKFNLMAVINDKRIVLQDIINSSYNSTNGTTNNSHIDVDTASALLEQESMKRQQWTIENQRRRHNYVPFCIQLLRELASMPVPSASSTNGNNDTVDTTNTNNNKSSSLLSSIVSTVNEKRRKLKQEQKQQQQQQQQQQKMAKK